MLPLDPQAGLGQGAVGIGLDLTEIAEFERLPFETNQAFYRRMFTDAEIAYCRAQASPARHFAARFAAKEAAVKAFSAVAPLGYWQIEVTRLPSGGPALRVLTDDRAVLDDSFNAYRPLVSLSHTDILAAAFVVVYAERRDEQCSPPQPLNC